jgi:hypothetical protein
LTQVRLTRLLDGHFPQHIEDQLQNQIHVTSFQFILPEITQHLEKRTNPIIFSFIALEARNEFKLDFALLSHDGKCKFIDTLKVFGQDRE